MRLSLIFVSLLLVSICAIGQELVINGSFESTKGKVKEAGQFEIVQDWENSTAVKCDLFSEESSSKLYGIPHNTYGRERAKDGKNYAGLVAYAYQGKTGRGYLVSQLRSPLEKGKTYCFSMYVSLGELSKYACDGIGAWISAKKQVSAGEQEMVSSAAITLKSNPIIEEKGYWQEICGKFTAKGGEEFIHIGNFKGTSANEIAKLKKPKDFSESQVNIGYYYFDQVSLKPYSKGMCDCNKEDEIVMKVVKKTVDDAISKEEHSESLYSVYVHFQENTAELKGVALSNVQKLLSYMQTHSDMKLALVGHANNAEVESFKKNPRVLDIDLKRAEAVAAYLEKNGIPKARLKVEHVKNLSPLDLSGTPEGEKENCVVHVEPF